VRNEPEKEKVNLESGYRVPYDPWPVLERLSSDRSTAMSELWENLYHQGDVGSASYAAVPKLVEAGEHSLVAAIEVARHDKNNPSIPLELESQYQDALKYAVQSVPAEQEFLLGYYVIHASLQGQHKLSRALNLLDVDEVLSEYK
jgi:hypothetical protein